MLTVGCLIYVDIPIEAIQQATVLAYEIIANILYFQPYMINAKKTRTTSGDKHSDGVSRESSPTHKFYASVGCETECKATAEDFAKAARKTTKRMAERSKKKIIKILSHHRVALRYNENIIMNIWAE